jgi:DNA modification methylase
VPQNFQEGFVVLKENLHEEDRERVNQEWPDDLVDPETALRKELVPEGLRSFFEDVKPGANPHPTMKPLALMTWLVKLVTPKGGTVLDPYCGSGTTCVAALDSECHFVGIEKDPVFHGVATKRIEGMKPELEKKAESRRGKELFNFMEELEQE